MIKKVLALMLVLSSVLLCGCDNSKRIDKAVIIECIIVDKSDYKFIYISDEEKSETVKIEEESLEKALKTLKNEHKPEIVLSKLELIAFAENVDSEKYYSALQYIKNNYAVSPSVMILEKKDTDISSTLLKMNNNLNKSKKSLLYLPHISKNNGVTGEKVEIMIKK